MIDSKQRYMMRGVSAMKEDVHNAIKNIDKGIFPQAFCKIIPDILGGDVTENELRYTGAGRVRGVRGIPFRRSGEHQ